jgi:hypothetical protein
LKPEEDAWGQIVYAHHNGLKSWEAIERNAGADQARARLPEFSISV